MCLQLRVFGGEEARVELYEHEEALGRGVVVAPVVGEVRAADGVHGAVRMRQELARRLQEFFLAVDYSL